MLLAQNKSCAINHVNPWTINIAQTLPSPVSQCGDVTEKRLPSLHVEPTFSNLASHPITPGVALWIVFSRRMSVQQVVECQFSGSTWTFQSMCCVFLLFPQLLEDSKAYTTESYLPIRNAFNTLVIGDKYTSLRFNLSNFLESIYCRR